MRKWSGRSRFATWQCVRATGSRRASVVACVTLTVFCGVRPVWSQTPASGDPVAQQRMRVISPGIQITDVGWNDNIFRVGKADAPAGDYTATVTPDLQISLPWSRLQLTGATRAAFNYFQRFEEIRSIDTDGGAAVAVFVGRLTPHVGGSWINARHRRNFEIDLPVRRVDWSWDAGVDVNVSAKTSIGVTTRRSHGGYSGETVYLESDLASVLGDTSTIRGVGVRYALTPLTTVGAEFERDNDRFPRAPQRNADGVRLMSVVAFRPRALVSGEARIGMRSRTFNDRNAPPFHGTVARVDLSYTLLGRTRFTVRAQRDLSYSYRPGERDYLETGTEVTVTHRIASAWDMVGSVGRFSLLYGLGDGNERAEHVLSYGLDVGRNMARARIGFQVARQTRSSDFSVQREYEEMRISSSLTYRF
jgi:hypothetical protein